MFSKTIALCFLVFLCELSFGASATLDQHPEWMKLVQYKTGPFGGHTSRGRTSNYYLAEDGRTNPKTELEALAAALRNLKSFPGSPDESARCRFPARSKWLAEKLNLELPPDSWCPEFNAWKTRVGAQSVTIVFSSYYLNSPSSMYGHTLLRLNRRPLSQKQEDNEGLQLLDFGFNYGANPNSKNPILYALSGLTGLMPGSFLALPYFYKVREYNDYEVRDLWEYDLKLAPQEVERLVDHFWEVAHTTFGYLYVTENCGYQILNLLDVAAPQYGLIDQLRYWVVPGDTIRILNRAGLVDRVQFRSSIGRQFLTRDAMMNKKQKQILRQLVQPPYDFSLLNDLTSEERAQVVDASMDLLDLIHSREYVDPKAPIKKVKNKFLLERSKLPITAPLTIEVPIEEEPHSAHPSGRMSFGTSNRQFHDGPQLGFYDFSYRAALHDLADPGNGYLKNTSTEMGHLKLRYDDRQRRLKIQQATLVHLDSLAPLSEFNKKSIWRIGTGMYRRSDQACIDCLRTEGEFGMGYALSPHHKINVYGLLLGRAAYASGFEKLELAAHLGPVVGASVALSGRLNLLLEWNWLHTFQEKKNFNMTEGSALARYFINRRWAVEAAYAANPFEKVATANALLYF